MIKYSLKNKKLLFAAWGCEIQESFIHTNWYLTLKELFGKTILFDPRKNTFNFGKDKMNEQFIKIIEKEQPDYILFCVTYDEFSPDFFDRIRKSSPKTKLINLFSDDEWNFDNYSRYYALFFDYLITVKKDLSDYKREGIKNIHFLYGVSEKEYLPQEIEKKYDVSFIGSPIRDRPDFLKFLVKNGINMIIAGSAEWEKYPELKNNYIGFLNQKDFFKTINQSKINLVFSKTIIKGEGKTDSHLKLRVFEFASCKSFGLIEYTPGLVGSFRNKKINFKTKEELLERIKYYLKNEDEREKLTAVSHDYFIKHFTLKQKFLEFFEKISRIPIKNENILPPLNKKIITLFNQDMSLPFEKIKKKIEPFDYIQFNNKESVFSEKKEYFQAYSLEKSKKSVSCCDYYVFSKTLGNFLAFRANLAFRNLGNKANKFLNINQLMVSKAYFTENFGSLQKLFFGKEVNLLSYKDTVFVSIPLIQTKKLKILDYESMNKAFIMKFKDKLYSLFSNKKFFDKYSFFLLFSSLFGKTFILKYILNSLSNKDNLGKLKEYN
jgi:spore maturation protein CgeB